MGNWGDRGNDEMGGGGRSGWKNCFRDDHNSSSRNPFETLTNAFYSVFQN